MITTKRIPTLIKVLPGLLNSGLPLGSIHPPQLFTGAPVVFPADFEDFVLRNQTPGARAQPEVTNGCNHDPTMGKLSDSARGHCALLWVVCRVDKETREKPTLYPINTFDNYSIDIGVKKLGVLD